MLVCLCWSLPVYAGGWTSPSAIDAVEYAETVLLDSRVEQVQIELSLQVQTRRLIRHWLDKTSGDIYHTHFCVIPHPFSSQIVTPSRHEGRM